MKYLRPLAVIALTGIVLSSAACAADPADIAAETASVTAAFPVTVTVPGTAEPLTITAEPQRIVALSSDAAIALHELGLTERLIAIPAAARNATLNPYADEMADVENIVAGENSPEPEQVLALSPDLIVVTARHTGEQDASDVLSATGVPVLTLTNGWSSSDAVIENLEVIGTATGTADEAEALVAEIGEGLAEVRESAAQAASAPSVVILSNQAQVPFINAGSSLVSELLANGGGTNAAEQIGITQTMPIQPEQLVATNPDAIMLVDVTGKGEASFDAVLGNPAVAALPAVQEGRVKLFLGRDVYALAGREVVSGSAAVLSWLHPELSE
ncbi:ABC transporter substrate-binding protein [Microbacterium sp. A93]|uniref:ABC transporter substrate-binding protein n=1 Tax=unclassified Microbacterium TaxID=2609290 RepID=UPI003F424338